jgi:hypothetical protein
MHVSEIELWLEGLSARIRPDNNHLQLVRKFLSAIAIAAIVLC